MTRVAILGGGPAGVGAAYRLRATERADVVLFEQKDDVGGNAGSFARDGHHLDYGSHRLHPATAPAILAEIQGLLGGDLLDRPRHGRIRLLGKWVHFPLKPVDLLFNLDKSFAFGSLKDRLRKGGVVGAETFASVLEANLGPTICDHFYFPYARKIWGHAPEELSAIQAYRRVSAGSFGKLVKKVLASVPGLRPKGSGRFFYPKEGFGQISRAYADAARGLGADLRLERRVTDVRRVGEGFLVGADHGGVREEVEVDHVWSTLPITLLARLVEDPPAAVRAAAEAITYRSMILAYLELDTDRFTEFDAHYFPGADLVITRLSEPKNYAVRAEPKGRTVLCAEIPCQRGDELWEQDDQALGELVVRDLAASDLPLAAPPRAVWTARLPQAYPIYQNGYEEPFAVLDAWATALPRILTYGRQGLFAHDNTHHALAMAHAAVDCLEGGRFDSAKWTEYRRVFATHVVED